MTQKESILHWRQGAQDAMEAAELLQRAGKHALALFHCHLAAEKSLKAEYIREKDDAPPKTHVLLEIALALSCPWTDREKEQLNQLSLFAVAARYDELDEKQAGELEESVQWWIDETKKIFAHFTDDHKE